MRSVRHEFPSNLNFFFPLTGSSARLVCPGDFIWAFSQETDTSIRRAQSPMCGARPWGDAKDCAARLQSGIVNNVGRCTISGFGRLGNVTDFWGRGGGKLGFQHVSEEMQHSYFPPGLLEITSRHVYLATNSVVCSYKNKGNDHQLKELLIVKQILLVSSQRKCIENSMENIHTEVRVQRIIVNVICRFKSCDPIFL